MMFLRFGGLLLIYPLFVMARIPIKVRLALALMIGAVLAGNLSVAPDWRSMGMGDMLGIVFFEMCAGVLMGLVCRMVYYALEIAGLRISTDSGLFVTLNFAGIEGIPQQAPSIILFLLASIMMVGMDLHYFIIEAVQASYQLLPIGGGQFHGGLINQLGSMIGNVFVMGILISAPVMAIGFLVNFIMALMGRAVARINVFAESFSIRLLCGIGVFGATIAVMAEYIANFIRTIPNGLVITARIFAGN
jgi:flagellar biosynthetic protein FliR